MSKNILFLKYNDVECENVISDLQKQGYHVVEYVINDEASCISEDTLKEIDELLLKNFFYYALSKEYHDEIYKVCVNTATKYVTSTGQIQLGLHNYYSLLQGEKVFGSKEEDIYETINKLYWLHKTQTEPVIGLKDLKDIEDEEEIVRLTEEYFAKMESEQELYFCLKEQLMEYIDELLKKQTEDSWREIVLWNKRHECRRLCNRFWQFYLVQKASSIFAEEMIHYYKCGEVPSIVRFRSFEELSETYFHSLLLLRRLNYDVASEEESDIVDYIMEKKISGIFIRHVIEQNQVEDKEKVYKRLEELLI